MKYGAFVAVLVALSASAFADSVIEVSVPEDGGRLKLGALRDQARQLRQKTPKGERVVVSFAAGTYFVDETLSLFKADSGIDWTAAEPGKTVIRGGRPVPASAFRPVTINGVAARQADVSNLLPGELKPWPKDFRRPPSPWLYRNGEPMTIARWPNSGWATFTNSVVSAHAEADGPKSDRTNDAIVFDDPRAAQWNFEKGIWFYGYWCHDWSENYVQGADYDPEHKALRFAGKHQYGFGGKTWGFAKRRFFALNALSELDAPGEWFLDRETKTLFVVPQANEQDAECVLATFDQPFVRADGLTDATISGFVFEDAHANTGVMLDHADGLTVDRCTFRNLAGKGLQLTGRNSVVHNCRFERLGAAAIVMAGGDRKTLTPSGLVIEHCAFFDWARFERTYNPGVLSRGCGNVVRNCTFRQAPHNAILYGGNNHLFEDNEFDHVLMETGDAGAIYCGRNASELGTVIRGNWFHDLGDETKRDFTSAVYFDDCDWGDDVISNRFDHVGRAILLGGGNLHRIEGNTFSDSKIAIHIDGRGKQWKRWTEDPGWFEGTLKEFLPLNDAWKTAYPDLERTLKDDPAAPWNNQIIGNTFRSNDRNFLFDKDTESVTNRMTIVGNVFEK